MVARRRKVCLSCFDLQRPGTDLILDPNMPKRGLSAYMFFANEQRDKVRDENPGIKFGMFDLLRLFVHF